MHSQVCAGVLVHECTFEGQRLTLGAFNYRSRLSPWDLPVSITSALGLQACTTACLVFMWVLGVHPQICMFVEHAPSPTGPSFLITHDLT